MSVTPVFTLFWDTLMSGVWPPQATFRHNMPVGPSLLRRQVIISDCFTPAASILKMLLQNPVLTRRPSGPTTVIVTGSLLFILFLLTASRSGVRAKASAYFPGSDSSDILQDVFNRTLGVSVCQHIDSGQLRTNN